MTGRRMTGRTARLATLAALTTLAALAVTGCSDGQSPGYKVLDNDDTTITVSSGARFALKFRDNPSVGTEWKLAGPKPDGTVVKFSGDDYETDEPGTDGSGGTRYLKFRAREPGSTRIVLTNCYRCAGNGAEQGEIRERRSYRVTVQE